MRKKLLAAALVLVLCFGTLTMLAASPQQGLVLLNVRCANTFLVPANRQSMDIYLPAGHTQADAILFIHGGGWMIGDKGFYTDACLEIQAMGFAAATMNYRFLGYFNNNSAADMLNDIHAAIEMLVYQGQAHGVTINTVALMGDSAGAHLALLYAYTRHHVAPVPISFVVGMVAPTDFMDPYFVYADDGAPLFAGMRYFALALAGVPWTARDSDTESFLRHAEALRAVSPLHHVTPNVPPTILAVGGQDDFVSPSNGWNLYRKLREHGVQTEMFYHANSGHFLGNPADHTVNEAFFARIFEFAQAQENSTRPTTIAPTTSTTTTTQAPTTTHQTTTTRATTTTQPPCTILSTRWPCSLRNWLLFFLGFGWVWMWF